MGANESIKKGPGNGSIYNTIFTFGSDGCIINHHRKLMPTYTEKLIHGMGDGSGLRSVEAPFGRLGSLICWEHWMPLARQAMHDEGEDIHIALWPQVKEMNHVASRQYAFEGRCHVVAVGQIMHRDELPESLSISNRISIHPSGLVMNGGSAIYGPNGDILLPPQQEERKIIYHEINLSDNRKENMSLSVSGHYRRNDVFELKVNRKRI